MQLTPALAAYLFKIGQKLHKGERVEALMKCPECDTFTHRFTEEEADRHVTITQRIWNNNGRYKDIEYTVVGCEGYWVVNPDTLGITMPNWTPLYEVVKKQRADGE